MPAFAEQFGQALMCPYLSANTRANLSDTCAPQWLHSGIVFVGKTTADNQVEEF